MTGQKSFGRSGKRKEQTMSRYIDADALIKDTWFVLIKGENIDDIAEQIIRQCKRIVKDAPSIDIVRCKECKWGKPYSDKQLECDALGLGGLKSPDDFCSYGERE